MNISIEKLHYKENGGCMLCKKGKLSEDGRSLIYPYEEVLHLNVGAAGVRLCNECAKVLAETLLRNTDSVK